MGRGIVVLLLIAGPVALLDFGLRAQSEIVGEVRTENGLHRAKFSVPQGTIHVNFPDDVASSDTIAGTVYTEASGRNPKELAKNSGEITGYVVELPGQKASASERRFHWNVPAAVAGGAVTILLHDGKNKIVGRCSVPVVSTSSVPETGGIVLPRGAQAGSIASAWGPFGGSPETSVRIGDRNADVVAESPRKLIFQTPADVTGPSTIEIRKGALSASGPFISLGLRTGVTKSPLLPGETATMSAIVSGLQGLNEPASLVIVNHDPGTVALTGGSVQRVAIPPAEAKEGGTFELTRMLTGVKGGAFDITVAVNRPPFGEIPVEALAGRSVDRWSAAQHVPVSADARTQIVAGVMSARSQLDELLAPQIGFRADLGTELDWLVREYCFVLRDGKFTPGGSGLLAPRRLPLTNAFAPQNSVSPGGGAVSLESSDVSRHSFPQFIAQLLARLTPSDPLGSLSVTSRPDRQSITVDQASGSLTTGVFVLSVGRHTVRVASCVQSIVVNPNQQTAMSCPP